MNAPMLEERLAGAQRALDTNAQRYVSSQQRRQRLVGEAVQAGWSDQRIADALGVKRQRVNVLRQRYTDALKSGVASAD